MNDQLVAGLRVRAEAAEAKLASCEELRQVALRRLEDSEVRGNRLETERDALKARIRQSDTALRAWEQWEADIILEGDCWREEDGLPHITQGLWDRVIELQSLRNAALSSEPAPDPRDAVVDAAVAVGHGANIDTMRALAVAVDAYLKERGDV